VNEGIMMDSPFWMCAPASRDWNFTGVFDSSEAENRLVNKLICSTEKLVVRVSSVDANGLFDSFSVMEPSLCRALLNSPRVCFSLPVPEYTFSFDSEKLFNP
jgi:hypothetical protein